MLLHTGCMPSHLGMNSDDSRIDPHLDLSSDDDGVEVPDRPRGNPSDDMEGYAMAQELEREILDKINRVSKTRNLRLSQVKLLEGQLQKIRESRRWSKAEVRKLKEEVKKNTDIALSDYGNVTLQIKCEGCRRQMGTNIKMLFQLEEDINIFGHTWVEKGNPRSPTYPSLRSFYSAHPGFKECFPGACVYCYREKDIQRAKQKVVDKRRQHESLGREYTKYAQGANRSRNKQKTLTKKQEKVQQEIKHYQASIDAYAETAGLLESHRKNALDDFSGI